MAGENDRKVKYLIVSVLYIGIFLVLISIFLRNSELQIEEESDSQTKEEWETMMQKRFSERKNLLSERCSSYNGSIPKTMKIMMKRGFLFSKKYNLLTCITAKAGVSTWKAHFLRMTGYTKDIGNPHRLELNQKIVAILMMSPSTLNRKKFQEEKGLIRVISVRNPFSRLVSAYRDKFKDGFRTYKEDRFLNAPRLKKLLDDSIHPNKRVSVPFSLFLRGVIEQSRGSVYMMNGHWRPFTSNCSPCNVSYDYIVKQETFEDDLRYLVLKVGIKEIKVDARRNKSKRDSSSSYESYFKDIPDSIIAKIYSIYKDDLYLLGYDTPQFVEDALSRIERNET